MTGNVTNPSHSYFRQIDALRTLAVSMVIFSHWAGYHQNLWTDSSFWYNGEVGVQLFFIISGFLITGILLDEREKAEQSGLNKSGILRAFYIRRLLRIFPLFYATLFLGFVLGHPDVKQSIHWHLSYLSNFYFAWRGEYLGDVSHFWSLAVEEQFYFFWPFVILFLRRQYMVPSLIVCICIAPVFRFMVGFVLQGNDVAVNVLPVSSLDSLAGGSLLAVLQRSKVAMPGHKMLLRWIIRIGIAAGFGYVLLRTMIPVPEDQAAQGLFAARVLLIPALYTIVWWAAKGINGPAGLLLEARPLSYVGKISYGIYVFHFFIPGATAWLCYRFDFLIWERFGVHAYLLLNILVLLSISALSWHFFESRINALKRYFPYRRDRPSRPVLAWLAIPYTRFTSKRSD